MNTSNYLVLHSLPNLREELVLVDNMEVIEDNGTTLVLSENRKLYIKESLEEIKTLIEDTLT
jgi:hypothetical protein